MTQVFGISEQLASIREKVAFLREAKTNRDIDVSDVMDDIVSPKSEIVKSYVIHLRDGIRIVGQLQEEGCGFLPKNAKLQYQDKYEEKWYSYPISQVEQCDINEYAHCFYFEDGD